MEKSVYIEENNKVTLIIEAKNSYYSFGLKIKDKKINLGTAKTKYLSSEVAGGFTGVMIGLYAFDKEENNYAEFKNFKCLYS